MSKRITAKHKIDRRLWLNLWSRPKSPFNIRAYGPGQHGQRRKKPTDFGTQFFAKQKLKGYYGSIGEKMFRRYYDRAASLKGDTSQNLIGLLESRLDVVVYRAKFSSTVFAVRQFVNHRHVLVNDRRVNIGSYLLKEGDVIKLEPKAREFPFVIEAMASGEREVPEYIAVDERAYTATFLRMPRLEEVPYPVHMEPNLVVEFYSR